MRTFHLTVRGRVQGVSYRSYVKGLAKKHGIVGFVRNLPDGSVEIMAQGGIDGFLEDLRDPPYGTVEAIETTETDEEPFDGFAVRHGNSHF